MSFDPRSGSPVLVREVREAARQQARTLSGGLVAVVAAAGAVLLMALFVVLDYGFNQETHRLAKIAAGLGVVLFIVVQPRIGLWLLPVVAPFLNWAPDLPVPGLNALNALLLSVFVTWAIGRTLERQPWVQPHRLGWVMVALLAVAGLSIIRGAAFPTGHEYAAGKSAVLLFRTSTTFAPYVIALFMARGESDRHRLAFAIALGLAAEVIATLTVGEVWGGRAMGTMGQPNVLGAYFAISTTIVAALALAQTSVWKGGLLALVAMGGVYGVMLSVSRGALAAVAIGVLYVAVRSSRVLTLLILVVLVTSPMWAPAPMRERVLATVRPVEEASDETELEGSAQARLDTWQATVRIASEHWIDGVGFGGLGYVLGVTGERLGLLHTKDSPHNTFLRVVGEMGIVGLLLLLWLLWRCWMLARDGLRVARDRFEHQLAVALGGATLVVIVNCWFGDRFFEVDIMCAYWMLAALVNGVVNEVAKEAR